MPDATEHIEEWYVVDLSQPLVVNSAERIVPIIRELTDLYGREIHFRVSPISEDLAHDLLSYRPES